ncbi:G-type lectin S-receptor-like serine/threonine-protein kinase RLK1 [Capsicum chinense]|nr:G-type lectin S-receptor-like serine/threonine-protein kinase RLK1 [Capsicum chinense]
MNLIPAIFSGFSRAAGKTSPMPSRNPPPPPSAAESNPNASLASHNSKAGVATGPIGAFWNTQHATSASVSEDTTRPKFDEEIRHSSSSYDKSHPNKVPVSYKTSPLKEESLSSHPVQNNMQPKPANRAGEASSRDFEINLFQDDSGLNVGSNKSSKLEGPTGSQGEAYNAFVAEFCTNKPNPGNNAKQPEKKELMEAEVEKLKQQLSRANMEKSEIASKYEKLSAICRSQRQEIQELKQALAARTPSPSRDTTRNQASPGSQPSSTPPKKNNIGGTVWELQQGLFGQSHVSPDSKPWQAFADDDPKQQATPVNANRRSVRTRNGHQNRETSETNTSSFGTDSFRAVPVSSSQMMATFNESKNSQRYGELKNIDSKSATQPAGWAGRVAHWVRNGMVEASNITLGSSVVASGNSSAWLSPSGDFASGFHQIWFDKIPNKTLVWYANGDEPAPEGSKLELKTDGQVVLENPGNAYEAYFWSHTVDTGYPNVTGNRLIFNESARISDFGLAKLLMKDQTRTLTGIRGTKGYVAPEWFRNTAVTAKVDVYSYGIVLLETICCRKCMDTAMENEEEIILIDRVYDCFHSRMLHNPVQDDDEALSDMR